MFAGAGTVDGRAAGALINALRLVESLDMLDDELFCPGCGCFSIKEWVLETNSPSDLGKWKQTELKSEHREIPGGVVI